ncbi:desulfoferrodoxin family protein [Zongyangia hominis]|uniref:Desulfoferrodoxin n=1 Tax=Zongyangia hominis TaxID=2763677 RepID=A0A926EAB0_9FIRM|nr:desulfoferrodoxin family protein [Zongyangia hominis]MBC8570217.1 desulfoferrodoxin [Zongyangia hominis]
MAQHDQKFFICKHCGNLVGMIHNAGVPIICCGEPMQELEANSTEAAGEKHLPVVKVEGDKVSVDVGSTHHPMSEEHSIQWIYLETKHGGQRKGLSHDAAPQAEFTVVDDKPVSVYAYCNLHGLWRTMVK